MKRLITTILIWSIVISTCIGLWYRGNKYKEMYNKEYVNVKAYEKENSNLKDQAVMFEFTMSELKNSKDSVTKALADAVKKLKKKDVQQVQYITSTIHKTDTVWFPDTLFVDKYLDIDTTLQDRWYSMYLKLAYPNKIITSPNFISEKKVIINSEKVYNGKRSKLFFIRWFQKKHREITVNVVEENPYIENKELKFIKITK